MGGQLESHGGYCARYHVMCMWNIGLSDMALNNPFMDI